MAQVLGAFAIGAYAIVRPHRLELEKGSDPRYHAKKVYRSGTLPPSSAARLGVPVVAKTGDEAAAHFGWFAHFAALDNPASSTFTQERLGWRPVGPALLPDLDRPRYFES